MSICADLHALVWIYWRGLFMWPYCEKKKWGKERDARMFSRSGSSSSLNGFLLTHISLKQMSLCHNHSFLWSLCPSCPFTMSESNECFRELRREWEKIYRFCGCVRENQTSSFCSTLKKHATKLGNLICSRSNPSNIKIILLLCWSSFSAVLFERSFD